MFRKAEQKLTSFFQEEEKKVLLITGARQVGKTFIIREFGRKYFPSFVEINFIEDHQAKKLFEGEEDTDSLLIRISEFSDKPLLPKNSLIFFDEVQECPQIVTAIKFLAEEGSYRYVLSGSLLGVDLKDIRSVPVGYMDIFEMFPMDLEEFALANGVSEQIIEMLRSSFKEERAVDDLIHEKMMELFQLYLIVGGMPAVVEKFTKTNNLQEVLLEQEAILRLYKKDIAKYDRNNKLYLEEILELIPSELNAKNKRFILKNLNENFKFSRYQNSFLWLKDAGVALPTYCADEPKVPLLLSKSTNLFKLFLADVGLLASMYMDGIQIRILNREIDINFGAVYENMAAQELRAHGFDLYYFNNKKQGEVDFLVEASGSVLPIEIKSGKGYLRHVALDYVLKNEGYGISNALVFHNGNLSRKDKILYCPMYMLMFVERKAAKENALIYNPYFSLLA